MYIIQMSLRWWSGRRKTGIFLCLVFAVVVIICFYSSQQVILDDIKRTAKL